MKPGDLVFVVHCDEVGIVMSKPRLSEDCKPGGEAYPYECYYLVDVLIQSGEFDSCFEEDLELISEGR